MSDTRSDRELLAAAAKAAGIEIKGYDGTPADNPVIDFDRTTVTIWNPLADDGDCARMEAALLLRVTWTVNGVFSRNNSRNVFFEAFADHGDDRNAARRRASVRAAAAIRGG